MTKFFREAFTRDKNRCIYCGKDMLQDFKIFMSTEENHLKPKSLGGDDASYNVVISCNVCNRLKGNYYPEELERQGKGKVIEKIRQHIMEKRAAALKDFLWWVNPDEKDYHS